LIGPEDGANRLKQLALLALESVAGVAMHLFELLAMIVQHLAQLRAL
jgi:hypothetical protein